MRDVGTTDKLQPLVFPGAMKSGSDSGRVREMWTVARRGLLLWNTMILAACACVTDRASEAGDDSGESSSGAEGTTATSGRGGTSESGSSSTTGSTGSSGGDVTGGTPDLGPCGLFIECVRETTPEGISSAIATYGEEGTCWQLPGVTEDDCWTECAALLQALQDAYPNEEACWDCDDGECVRPGTCTIDASDDACTTCNKQNCCDEIAACQGSAACSCLLECSATKPLEDCYGPAECNVIEIPPEAVALGMCTNAHCATC